MWRKMPRVHHRHNPRLERRSTWGSFWQWRGNCGNRIEGYRHQWFRKLEEPSCPLGLSPSTHQWTLWSLKVTRENYTQTPQPLNQSNCNNILYYTKLVEQNPNGKRLTDEKEKKPLWHLVNNDLSWNYLC